jgi:predicted phage terminase large subunit-like protein
MGKIFKRRRGDILQPARFTEAVVRGLRQKSATFDPQYQQEPSPTTGRIFNPTWWRYYRELPEFEMVVLSVDCTFKSGRENDLVAIHKWGMVGTRSYLIERQTEHMGYIASKAAIRSMQKHGRRASVILIEDKANGPAIVEELKADADFGAAVIAIDPQGDKFSRANASSADVEAGAVYLPEGAEWTTAFVKTFAGFPAVKHDDDVDALSQFINWRRGRNQAFGVLDWGKRVAQDVADGIRDLYGELIHPKPKPELPPAPKPVQARVDGYGLAQKLARPGPCPNCQSKATVRLGAPGNIHCNQCSCDFSLAGEVVNRPVSTECGCGNPLVVSLSGRKHCNSCGWDSPVSPAQPTNGATFRQLKRRGYMLRVPGEERFPWDNLKF